MTTPLQRFVLPISSTTGGCRLLLVVSSILIFMQTRSCVIASAALLSSSSLLVLQPRLQRAAAVVTQRRTNASPSSSSSFYYSTRCCSNRRQRRHCLAALPVASYRHRRTDHSHCFRQSSCCDYDHIPIVASTSTKHLSLMMMMTTTNTEEGGDDDTTGDSINNINTNRNNMDPSNIVVNGEIDNETTRTTSSSKLSNGTEKTSRKGRTGWNHNLPDESSEFWIRGGSNSSSGDAAPAATESTTATSTSSSSSRTLPKFRTGWLHNQVAPQSSSSQTTTTTSTSSSRNALEQARERLKQAKVESQRNHCIISPVTFHMTSSTTQVRLAVTEHVISVPLQYETLLDQEENEEEVDVLSQKNCEFITVFFTIVERVENLHHEHWLQQLQDLSPTHRAQRYVEQCNLEHANSLCLYLQGGPGFGSPTPITSLGFDQPTASWAAQALYSSSSSNGISKIVLLDQRGTGKSTPVTKQTLERQFPNLFLLDQHDTMKQNEGGGGGIISISSLSSLDELEATYPNETGLVRQAIEDVTNYLSCFRADSIVQDAELVREALLVPRFGSRDDVVVATTDGGTTTSKTDNKIATTGNNKHNINHDKDAPKPWGVCLGQSFGGFCLMTYLSQVRHPPQVALFTGGIAPIMTPLREVYTRLWKRVRQRSLQYYDMYPGDIRLVKRIVQRLLQQPALLPSGGVLTARRFLQIGLDYLGSSPSAFAAFHQFLSTAVLSDLQGDCNVGEIEFSRAFLKSIESSQSFDDHPIYFWLHEAIYANGGGGELNGGNGKIDNVPTAWAAHSAHQELMQSDPKIWDYRETSQQLEDDSIRTLFFGEMVFPWMADGDYVELSGLGLRMVAHALAHKTDWKPLFNTTQIQMALSSSSSNCRAAAAVYYDDFYVDFDCAMQVLRNEYDGPMKNCKILVTNEYQHSGLRDDGANLFAKLHGMATGTTRIPS